MFNKKLKSSNKGGTPVPRTIIKIKYMYGVNQQDNEFEITSVVIQDGFMQLRLSPSKMHFINVSTVKSFDLIRLY